MLGDEMYLREYGRNAFMIIPLSPPPLVKCVQQLLNQPVNPK